MAEQLYERDKRKVQEVIENIEVAQSLHQIKRTWKNWLGTKPIFAFELAPIELDLNCVVIQSSFVPTNTEALFIKNFPDRMLPKYDIAFRDEYVFEFFLGLDWIVITDIPVLCTLDDFWINSTNF